MFALQGGLTLANPALTPILPHFGGAVRREFREIERCWLRPYAACFSLDTEPDKFDRWLPR